MQRRHFLNGMLLLGLGSFPLKTLAKNTPLLNPGGLTSGAELGNLSKLPNTSRQAGLFQATLTAAPSQAHLVKSSTTACWTYNHSLPGPLIEVMEGDTVEITLINQLPQPTTIHWHGLPVPPTQDGNPQDAIPPGQSHTYRFTIPPGSAGCYWYHPHPHGFTAEQVFRGLAGGFIVRAKNDPLAKLPERHLLLSDLKLDAQGQIAPNDSLDWMNGREGQFVLSNGQHQPVLRFSTQGRERWRVWNASNARYLLLQLPGSTFTLVGTDGGLVEKPVPALGEYLLAPGQRAELIVDAGRRRDREKLIAAIYQRGKMGDAPPEKIQPILDVDFSAVSSSTPPDLPARLATIPDLGVAAASKRVVFSEQMSMAHGRHEMLFLVNGKRYNMQRIDLHSRVHEVEEWTLINQSDMDHPFHLHGTQFQLVSRERNGITTPAPYRAWHDTLNLQPGETARIKTVQHWPGIRLFHCHILEHESLGMMGQLLVENPKA